jgi:hypothetical protein
MKKFSQWGEEFFIRISSRKAFDLILHARKVSVEGFGLKAAQT